MKRTWLEKLATVIIVVLAIELTVLIFIDNYIKSESENVSNVIDSLNKSNIVIEDSINIIDSIKYDYIEKNNSLSDSDAIELFYNLLKR